MPRWLIVAHELDDTPAGSLQGIEKALAIPEGADEPEPQAVAVIVGDDAVISELSSALRLVGDLANGNDVNSSYFDLWIDRRGDE